MNKKMRLELDIEEYAEIMLALTEQYYTKKTTGQNTTITEYLIEKIKNEMLKEINKTLKKEAEKQA